MRKNSIRLLIAIVVIMIIAFVSFNRRTPKIQQPSEAAGPIYDKEAAESARSSVTPTQVVSVSPSVSPIPKPTVTPTPQLTVTPQPTATPQATVSPKVSPTPQPEITDTAKVEEGTLSKPDHPEAVSPDKLIFIGDSRTEGIRDAVNDNSIWSCLSSMGYDWMTSTGVPQVESEIGANTAVIILMGVNDVYQVNNYIQYINAKAGEWAESGAKTYFVSVGPVEHDPYVTNDEIVNFNKSMQENLTGVTYIDIYSYLIENGFSTTDGIHYPNNVSIDIYNYILEHLEKSRSGIWG